MLQINSAETGSTAIDLAGPSRRVTLALSGIDDLVEVGRGSLVILDGDPAATRLVARHVVSANPQIAAVVHTADPERWTAELAAAYTGVPSDAILATGVMRSTNPAVELMTASFPLLTITHAFPGPSLVAEAAGLRPSDDVPSQLGLVVVEDLASLARAWSMTDAVDYLRGWAADLGATVVATSRADDAEVEPMALDRHDHVLDVGISGGGDHITTLDVSHRRSGRRWRHPLQLDLGRIELR